MNEINNRVIELCKEKKQNGEIHIYENIANIIYSEFGKKIMSENIRSISRRYRQANNLDENFCKLPEKHSEVEETNITLEFNKDGSQTSERKIELGKNEELTPNLLLQKHGFDINKFKLVSAKNSKWVSQAKGGKVVQLYSSKITVKPVNDFVISQENIDKIVSGIKIKPIKTTYKKTRYADNGKALVLPISDLHYQLLATNGSTGDNYTKEIAENLYYYIIEDVLERTQHLKFEKIFYTIGSDMFNSDNKAGTTTKGTPQNNDGEIEEAIIDMTDIIVNCIEKLRTISNVEVIYINSNHDSMTSFGVANTLRKLYDKSDDVNIDYKWIDRKYKVFGNTLLGFAHNLKDNKVNDIIQADARHLMSETTNTVYFLAHLHHENCKDVGGTDVRRLPTVSALSRWAYENGYNAVRKNQSFIIDGKFGITDVIYTFVE